MIKIKILLTIWLSKIATFVVRTSGRGSGTALPGLIAEKIFPDLIEYFSAKIEKKVLITGTNGKTTTQTVLASIFKEDETLFISNKSGSNLKRGLISRLVQSSNILGNINIDSMIFEVEEATLPKVIDQIKPDILIVTNFFRDQLDAYGEIDRTQKFIKEAINKAPQATLILNADDPRVVDLSKGIKNKTVYFGLEDNDEFEYESQKRDEVTKDVSRAREIEIRNDLTTLFKLGDTEYSVQISGKFHVYNITAAIVTAQELGIKKEIIQKGVEKTKPAFGRGEVIHIDDIIYKILLVKNPAGMNLTLDLLRNSVNPNLVFILNDFTADGKDVSWIWDSEFEILEEIKPQRIIVSGQRAEDLLLRIKYAFGGLKKVSHYKYITPQNIEVKFIKDISNIHKYLYKVKSLETGSKNYIDRPLYYVLPTYTAMLNFRKDLLGNALNE